MEWGIAGLLLIDFRLLRRKGKKREIGCKILKIKYFRVVGIDPPRYIPGVW
jgi:hypothetical protein